MKFKLIDQYTVRCVLTEDDMIENDIELEDFFHDREKVHNLLDVIMNRAKDEIGYELNDEILSMQIMPLPKNGLAITISGKNDKDVDDIMGNVKNLANIIDEELQKNLDEDSDDEKDEVLEEDSEDESMSGKKQDGIKSKTTGVAKDKTTTSVKGVKTYVFESFSDIEKFCLSIQSPKYITSSLYKDELDHKYYMVIQQGRLSENTYNTVCQSAMEFADVISRGNTNVAYIVEHFEKLIENKAVFTIRKIASKK